VSKNSDKKSSAPPAVVDFSQTVAGYFMEFLETDFKKRGKPKRKVSTYKESVLVGVKANKYPEFFRDVLSLLQSGFNKEKLQFISEGSYTKELPSRLLGYVNKRIDNISKKDIDVFLELLIDIIEKGVATFPQNIEKAQDKILDKALSAAQKKLVLPLTDEIEKPLTEGGLGDESTVYLLQEELANLVVSELQSTIESEIEKVFSLDLDEEIDVEDLRENLEKELTLKEIKSTYQDFFGSFAVTDLYKDVSELSRSKDILEKHDLYLYFGDIRYEKTKYPLFYTPISLQKIQGTDGNSSRYQISYEGKIYFNKKAVEYVVQGYKNDNEEVNGNPDIKNERIIYIAEHGDEISNYLNEIVNELTEFFSLSSKIDFTNSSGQVADGLLVSITNEVYLSLFDKADESLINDYEEILESLKDGGLEGGMFSDLINHFINEEPEPFSEEVNFEWEELTTGERLVYSSPIPLNEEQRKILSAVKKDGCKYITVHGPPGTGKSHTITAVVFDAILNGKSTLILSDKKEALDVVERKITKTLKQTRTSSEFQDPVLRLGDTGNNMHKILSATSTERIKTSYQAARQNTENLPDSIDSLKKSIEESIEAEVREGESIDIQDVHSYLDLEIYYENKPIPLDVSELIEADDSLSDLQDLITNARHVKTQFLDIKSNWDKFLAHSLGIEPEDLNENKIRLIKENAFELSQVLDKTEAVYEDIHDVWGKFEEINVENLKTLIEIIERLKSIRNPIFGYLLKKNEVKKIETDFRKEFTGSLITNPSQKINLLERCVEVSEYAIEVSKEKLAESEYGNFLSLSSMHRGVVSPKFFEELVRKTEELGLLLENVKNFTETYPKTAKELEINVNSIREVIENKFEDVPEDEREKMMRYIELKSHLSKKFDIEPAKFTQQKKRLEALSTLQMSFVMDKRFVDFYENNKNTANQLREIIKNKQQFPRDKFDNLKKAFPCILAGIRDYSEYIPLNAEAFDLVVIDEASQVSIAQALPALLRSKTVLILGDERQFANVKASQAKKEINQEHKNRLRDSFVSNITDEPAYVDAKLKYFDVKKSVLEFFNFINNYEVMLKKHFRGYKEIISFSNKFFYNEALQVTKVRAKPITEVLKFTEIKHDLKKELVKNTNSLEVKEILEKLENIFESNGRPSVGVITPFRNQQKLINKEAREHPRGDFFFNELDLKIMTFDSCQGEERDIIFYSMVANPEEDKLSHIFPASLNEGDDRDSLRKQRLNVGFSRAKEQMHFILSKPIEDFSGTAKRSLVHYNNVCDQAKEEKSVSEVDDKSPMEEKVLNWFYQTSFWKEYKDREPKSKEEDEGFVENLELFPQFDLGSYIRQLEPTYQHPDYTVDFLLAYKDQGHSIHNIVIEYDGFKEHFTNLNEVNEFNFKEYYKEEDVYRQKVLESYGYQFLRINRFNLGENPIEVLDKRIRSLVKEGEKINTPEIQNIQELLSRVQEGESKICPWCEKIREQEEFKDSSLITGYGHKCIYCKGVKGKGIVQNYSDSNKKPKASGYVTPVCPKCGSNMKIKNGRYGAFYGCSRYPDCKETRNKLS